MVNREGVCRDVVTIGASAGGVETLLKVLGDLPHALPAAPIEGNLVVPALPMPGAPIEGTVVPPALPAPLEGAPIGQ